MSTRTLDAGDRRQMSRPSSHIPWSVHVIRGVPRKVMEAVATATASCAAAGWAAVTTGDGYVQVWQQKTVPLTEPLQAPKNSLKLFFPELILNDNTATTTTVPNPIHMAISASTGTAASADAVHLYVWHDGWLWLRKLSTKDLQQSRSALPRSHTTKTRLDLDSDKGEYITSLTSEPGFLVLASSLGNLYWVTLTPVPVGLHVQKIAPQTGWLSRVVFGSTGATAGGNSPQFVLPLSATEFLSMAQTGGSIMRWKVTVTVGTAHHANFELVGNETSLAIPTSILSKPTVLASTMAANKLSIHSIVLGNSSGDTKLYWIQSKLDGTILRSDWLSRFAEPNEVQVQGIVAAENGTAYAAFSQPAMNGVLTMIMACIPDDDIIQEVDLPASQIRGLVSNSLELDLVTHGCSVLTAAGIGLRIRHIPQDGQPASKRSRMGSDRSAVSNSSLVHTLVSHLRSSFWQAYQDPERRRPVPPSLLSSDPLDIGRAVILFAAEIQHKGDAASSQNPAEWHRALISFLQEGGLYRSLSQSARWQLLSIGQELAVFGYVTKHQDGIYATVSGCKSYDLANWFLDLQQANTETTWNAFLAGALEAAMDYQDASFNEFYDLTSEKPAQPIWLSHSPLQTVLLRQLEVWRRNPNTVQRNHVESVVKAALRSYSYHCKDKEVLVRVQSLAIGLLRSMPNELSSNADDEDSYTVDELAFDLCIQFSYFAGLCQISVDHEKQRDRSLFVLDPLFESIQTRDPLSGFSFAQFVLQWHTDKKLYGHAINYGRHCPVDLNMIMDKNEQLRQYKWIPAIRQSYFDQATDSCLANCEINKTLGPTQWALSMAKLTNKLVVSQNKERQKKIEKKLELVTAQLLLEGEELDDENDEPSYEIPPAVNESPVRMPDELVRMALQRMQASESLEEQTKLATIALASCSAMEDNAMSLDYTTMVWTEVLRLNDREWTEWLRNEVDLTSPTLKEEVLSTTVFGGLLEECRKTADLSMVTYGTHMEAAIVDQLGMGSGGTKEFGRLLRSVSSTSDKIQGSKSLVVASF